MPTPNETEVIFARAEQLAQQGKAESALLLMSELVCSASQVEVRERAARLLTVYAEKVPAGLPSEAGPDRFAPPEQVQEEQRPPSIAGANRSKGPRTPQDRGYIFAIRKKREHRLQDTSIPREATLPQPLGLFLVQHLRMSNKSLSIPGPLLAVVDDLERQVGQLPEGRTQVEAQELLRSFAQRFGESPVGMEVFAALINIFYANGFLSTERAQDLSTEAEMGTQERTVRELLHADD